MPPAVPVNGVDVIVVNELVDGPDREGVRSWLHLPSIVVYALVLFIP